MEDREENIYNLVSREYARAQKGQKYSSKFKSSVKEDLNKTKHDHKTMGYAKVPLRAPQDFLKKHENEPVLVEGGKMFKYEDSDHRKPPVPKPTDAPIMGITTNKNFIKQNAMDAVLQVPKKPVRQTVDTRNGDKQLLEPSGLEPVYIHKKDFGQTPQYVEKRKEELKRTQAEYDAYVSEQFRQGMMNQLSEEERLAILDGLKTNWEQLHHEFQCLSVVIDTVPKKLRKERLEGEMKQLERDIDVFERHNSIYIAN